MMRKFSNAWSFRVLHVAMAWQMAIGVTFANRIVPDEGHRNFHAAAQVGVVEPLSELDNSFLGGIGFDEIRREEVYRTSWNDVELLQPEGTPADSSHAHDGAAESGILVDEYPVGSEEAWLSEAMPADLPPSANWRWRVLPAGLIYRSYMAGVHEPRISLVAFREMRAGQTLWDATLGGRGGVLRFGDSDAFRPQGWQLDVEGAVMVRLDVENRQDLESSDYRFGFPFTYGIDNWQFKFGYYHISSHLGDERMLREPGLDRRRNYVRDGLIYGVSYYPKPELRLYGEIGGAFNSDGGAEPFETQFGIEWSSPRPTGPHGAPFLAINGHLRQDHHFGGDLTTQTGWLWRGDGGQMMRLGFHYFNGKSSQFQFFNHYEQQVGVGIWYDF